ncbi:MAG: RnfABCDGE type electron transport complex subunit G [Ruminococcaceae bacterium]|nr:RnfABCDGE type electron transport complex subunit G [Oscillospiraceae bacterium]
MKYRERKELFSMVLTLLVIALVCSSLLGVVNALTKDKIAEIQAEALAQSMRQVLPDAEHFNEISGRLDPAFMEENDVDAIYLADDDGYVVLVSPRGFGGELVMTVGIDPDLAVTGIVITEQSETPGLGTKAQTPEYLSQYVGKTGTLQLVKGAAAEGQISAVSGATVSSRGITAGVQAALRAAGNVA